MQLHFFPELILHKYSVAGYDEIVHFGALGQKTVASNFGHCSDHWRGPERRSQLDVGCCVARQSWSGTSLLCARCIWFSPTNLKCKCDRRTRGCLAVERHDFEKRANQDHQPPQDMESLKVFWRSAGAADDVEQAEFVWHVGAVLAVHCHQEWEPDQRLPNSRGVVGFGWTTSGDVYWYLSKVSSGSRTRMQVARSAGAADGETEWKQQSCIRVAPEEKFMELSTLVGCGGSPTGRLDRDKASSHDEEKLNVVWSWWHSLSRDGWNCESSSVEVQSSEWGKVEISSGSDRDKVSSDVFEAVAGTYAWENCWCTVGTLHRCCQCCTSTNTDLNCLVVTALLSQSTEQPSSWSSHVADLVDLHT